MAEFSNVSAWFLDTQSRHDKTDDLENNFRKGVKAIACLLSFQLLLRILGPMDVTNESYFARRSCVAMGALYLAKTALQTAVLTKRRIYLIELCIEFGILWPASFALFGICLNHLQIEHTCKRDSSIYILTIFVFALGSQLYNEYRRKIYKETNANRVFTEAGFKLCRHINYLCEIIMVFLMGYICGGGLAFIPPFLVAFRMVCLSIPELEYYMRVTYGEDWITYTKKTKTILIPYIG